MRIYPLLVFLAPLKRHRPPSKSLLPFSADNEASPRGRPPFPPRYFFSQGDILPTWKTPSHDRAPSGKDFFFFFNYPSNDDLPSTLSFRQDDFPPFSLCKIETTFRRGASKTHQESPSLSRTSGHFFSWRPRSSFRLSDGASLFFSRNSPPPVVLLRAFFSEL